jgi:hypothetical protein
VLSLSSEISEEGDGLTPTFAHETIHKIIKVISDSSIIKVNKIKVEFSETSQLS